MLDFTCYPNAHYAFANAPYGIMYLLSLGFFDRPLSVVSVKALEMEKNTHPIYCLCLVEKTISLFLVVDHKLAFQWVHYFGSGQFINDREALWAFGIRVMTAIPLVRCA